MPEINILNDFMLTSNGAGNTIFVFNRIGAVAVDVVATNYTKFIENEIKNKGMDILKKVGGVFRKKLNIRNLLGGELIMSNKVRTKNVMIFRVEEATIVVIMYLARGRRRLMQKFQRVE